jgi:hypothetical protein
VKPLPQLGVRQDSFQSLQLAPLSPVPPPEPGRKVGLDLECVPMVSWMAPPTHKFVVCVGWGTEKSLRYIEAVDRRPGIFEGRELMLLWLDLAAKDTVVVGHNAIKFDLPLINGLMIHHGLDPLPDLRVIDTMNTLKTGQAYRNTLKAQCARYGVNMKDSAPDWDLILQGNKAAWEDMAKYNLNDVVSTLQLERALAAADIPSPVKVWSARKS